MIRLIEITFPVDMGLSEGFESKLLDLISDECKRYESQHPDRVMWPGGYGAKILWREPEEPDFDESVLSITVCERERYENENFGEFFHSDGENLLAEVSSDESEQTEGGQ